MKKKIKYIFLVLTPAERRKFWLLIALNVFISIVDIGALAFLLLVVSFYINNAAIPGLDFIPGWLSDPDSVTLIAIILILFGLKNLLGVFISNSQYKFIGHIAVRISKDKLEDYQRGEFEEFVNIDSAELIRKIAFQPFDFSEHILAGIQQIIIQSFLILITIAAIVLYNIKLFVLLFLILLPPVALVFFFIRKRVSAAKKNIHASNENSIRFLLDALKGYVEGNIYQRNDFFLQRFSSARQLFSTYLFDSLSVQAMPTRIIETFAVLGLFILIVIAKWSGVNDAATLITIGAFMAGAYKIIPGIVKIINASGQMRAYDFSIYQITSVRNSATDKPTKQPGPINSLQLKNINFKYGDHVVLNNFSLRINKGEFIGISGKSGRGKTTLLNLLLGFLSPDSGKIFVNEQEVSSEELKNLWPSIAYVRQQPFLIYDSILKNISLDEEGHDDLRFKEVLNISGLNELIDSSADGIHQVITEDGKNISGGQQQRIAIARALYKNVGLILLDEPFNELDEASTLTLLRYFKHLSSSGKIVIMITHDNKSLSYCNKIISLDE